MVQVSKQLNAFNCFTLDSESCGNGGFSPIVSIVTCTGFFVLDSLFLVSNCHFVSPLLDCYILTFTGNVPDFFYTRSVSLDLFVASIVSSAALLRCSCCYLSQVR